MTGKIFGIGAAVAQWESVRLKCNHSDTGMSQVQILPVAIDILSATQLLDSAPLVTFRARPSSCKDINI